MTFSGVFDIVPPMKHFVGHNVFVKFLLVRSYCIAGIAFLLLPLFVATGWTEDRGRGSISIQYEAGRIAADIQGADLQEVLAVLAKKTGLRIDVEETLSETVTLKVAGLPLPSFLNRLVENRALVFESVPGTNAYRLVGAGVYASRKGEDIDPAGEAKDPAPASAPGFPETSDQDHRPATPSIAAASPLEIDARGRPLYKAGEILVQFAGTAAEEEIAALHRRMGSRVLTRIPKRRLEKIAVAEGMTEAQAAARYSAAKIVETAERHALRYPLETPNDPLFDQQWGLERISAPAGWNFTTGDSGVVVAVVDTGAEILHPDLARNIWVNTGEIAENGIDDDGNGYIDDRSGWDFAGADPNPADGDPNGHGTHVAGIIAADGNNAEGVSGTGWHLKLMILKVMADGGRSFETFDVIEALQYARENGAKIVNCSFGAETHSTAEEKAFQDLETAGILTVCAAGNEGLDLDADGNDLYPAEYAFSNILAVAAGTRDDTLADSSNYGKTAVDVLAPGVSIKSTSTAGTQTEASVYAEGASFSAVGMLYAGTTDAEGISGALIDCGLGYETDFGDLQAGDVALIERGELYFSEKVDHAQDAGAAAVIIYNNKVDILDQQGGTLGSPGQWVPAVSVTQAVGQSLKKNFLGQTAVVVNQVPAAGYTDKQGTSMAAAFVSGLAGLIWSVDPAASYDQVKTALMEAADKNPALEDALVSGGRINAQGSLCSVKALFGDLNCDGEAGLADAIFASQLMSGKDAYVCTHCLNQGLDPVEDSRVTTADLIYLLQHAAQIR
jgi:subtilisin family serine protease